MKVALVVAAMAVAVATAQQSIDKVYFPENETSILDFANRASFDEVVTPDPLGVSCYPVTPAVPVLKDSCQSGLFYHFIYFIFFVATNQPNSPTLSPMTLITAQGEKCTCVPYFMCKPEAEFADQNKFNEIDVK